MQRLWIQVDCPRMVLAHWRKDGSGRGQSVYCLQCACGFLAHCFFQLKPVCFTPKSKQIWFKSNNQPKKDLRWRTEFIFSTSFLLFLTQWCEFRMRYRRLTSAFYKYFPKPNPPPHQYHFRVFHGAENNFLKIVVDEIIGFAVFVLDSYQTLCGHFRKLTGGLTHPV